MVQLRVCLLLLLILDELLGLPQNTTSNVLTNGTAKAVPGRRQLGSDEEGRHKKRKKGYRSTSSSSGEKVKKASAAESKKSSLSLEISTDFSTNEDSALKKQDKYARLSSDERKGWKKWHRKCHPCPEEMAMKWKDPAIKWICGAYQRARRSFKSLCMMHYRNCQDGTMFVKIHDHRCQDERARAGGGVKHGLHMFYTYDVQLSADYGALSDSKGSETDTDIYQVGNEYYRV